MDYNPQLPEYPRPGQYPEWDPLTGQRRQHYPMGEGDSPVITWRLGRRRRKPRSWRAIGVFLLLMTCIAVAYFVAFLFAITW